MARIDKAFCQNPESSEYPKSSEYEVSGMYQVITDQATKYQPCFAPRASSVLVA